jgi:hypothetical protein
VEIGNIAVKHQLIIGMIIHGKLNVNSFHFLKQDD